MLSSTSPAAVLAAFEDLPFGVAVLDRDLRFVEVNPALAAMNGIPREGHLGQTGPELLPQLSDVWATIRTVIATGEPIGGKLVVGETPATHGETRIWSEEYTPWIDTGTGALLGVVAIAIDVTARHHAEASAERRLRRLEAIAAMSAELVALADIDRVADAVARGAAAIMQADAAVVAVGTDLELKALARVGYTSLEGDQVTADDLITGTALADTARTGVEHYLNAGSEWDTSFPVGSALHRRLGLAATATVPLIEGGRRIGGIGVSFREPQAFDEARTALQTVASIGGQAVERARIIEARDASRRLMEAVADHLPVGLLVADPDGAFLYWNPELERIWGGRLPPRLGTPTTVSVTRDGDTVRLGDSSIARVLRGDTIEHQQAHINRADGSGVDIELTAAPVLDDAGAVRFGVAVVTDVTERKRAEALRDAFLGVMGHELKTPLTTIYGDIQLLEARDALRSDARASLQRDVVAETERLIALVDNLLVLTRLEHRREFVAPEPLLVERLVEDTVAREGHQFGPVSVEVGIRRGACPVLGDPAYVRQVVRNLLSNAMKYGAPPVEIRVEPDEGGVAVRVLDRGPGFSVSPDRLFELYVREESAARRATGSGIGLFVCRELVVACGGRMWAMNRDGGGAEFGFVLPHCPDDWDT